MEREIRPRRTLRIVGCAVLLLSPLVIWMALTVGGAGTFLYEDGLLYSFPLRVFLHDAFAHGHSPQWMPYSACGFSLLAEGQSGICSPAVQILYRIFPAESGWLIEMAASHLTAFLLCCLLLLQFRIGTLPALLGASLYTCCAATMFMSNLPPLMWGYALLPGILWSVAQLMEGRPRASVSFLIVVTLLLLTGHPVIITYTSMIAFAFVVCLAAVAPQREKNLLRVGARPAVLAVLVALAVLIATPQLLPMFQQLPFSARTSAAAVSLATQQSTKHLQPSWIPLALFPTPFDSTDWTYWSITVRFPAYALFLVAVGSLFGGKGLRRWFFVGLAVFVILLAAGPYVGLWRLVHSLPVLRNFRFPFRWLGFLPLSVSVLAALGLDRLLRQTRETSAPSFRWSLRFLLVAVVIAEVVVVLKRQGTYLPAAMDAWRSRLWLAAALWLSVTGMVLAAFLSTRRVTGRWPVVLGVSLTVVSLCATRMFYVESRAVVRDLRTIGYEPNRSPAVPQQYRVSSGLDTYTTWASNAATRYHSYTPNLSLLDGRLHTGHYCSFIPYWASDVSSWCQRTLEGTEAHERILDICSAKWLIRPDATCPRQDPPQAESSVAVKECENPTAIPRASIACSPVFCSDDNEIIEVLESPTFDARHMVALLERDGELFDSHPDPDVATDSDALPAASIQIDRPDRIEIEIEPAAPRGSVLVLSDTYYPGWKAFVDGVEEPVLRADYAFRGVRLPEGAKRVVFMFEPLVPDAVLPLPAIILTVLGLTLIPRPVRRNGR